MSLVWVLFAAVAYAGFVFLHWPITAFCDWLLQRMGFRAYELTAAGVFLAAGLATGLALSRRRDATSVVTWSFCWRSSP